MTRYNDVIEANKVVPGEYTDKLSVYTDVDGHKTLIPTGFTVSKVSSENIIWGRNFGLVIYQIPKECVPYIDWDDPDEIEFIQMNYDQFVYVPVSLLKANGTLDGKKFDKKFGRRCYPDDISFHQFGEEITSDHCSSIMKSGGFYTSRYAISKDDILRPRSIKNAEPWICIDFSDAIKISKAYGASNPDIKSHLTFGTEFDSVVEWVIESHSKTCCELDDSTTWGNYWNSKNSPKKVIKTGTNSQYYVNNIADLAGNIEEWTQEYFESKDSRVARDGSYLVNGDSYPVYCRNPCNALFSYEDLGFRINLIIK